MGLLAEFVLLLVLALPRGFLPTNISLAIFSVINFAFNLSETLNPHHVQFELVSGKLFWESQGVTSGIQLYYDHLVKVENE